jgi:hypothetical protein
MIAATTTYTIRNGVKIRPHHNTSLLDLVHLGDLLGNFGLGDVRLAGVNDVDALKIRINKKRMTKKFKKS